MNSNMTLSEKILARKSGKKKVTPGEFLLLEADVALANDITAPLAIQEFIKAGGNRVHNPRQIVLIPDHFTPNKDIKSAEQVKLMRTFAKQQKIEHFYETGRAGIEHVMLPEEGLVKSGDLVVGADSHTCTYGALGAFATGMGSTDLAGVYLFGRVWLRVPESIKIVVEGTCKDFVSGKDLILKIISKLGVNGANYKAMEFSGKGLDNLTMNNRFTIANMAVEAGGKVGIFPVDNHTINYEKERNIEATALQADPGAVYVKTIKMDLDTLEPQVAYPYLPSNCKDISDAEKDNLTMDQVVIGSCTNGRIEDLRVAAAIMAGKKVHSDVRCIILPGSNRVVRQALEEGLLKTFLEAECVVSTPTCGPCLGGHMGVLAGGERALSTTNRNFIGRMGHRSSEVYLASPAIAAATAIAGKIKHPDNI